MPRPLRTQTLTIATGQQASDAIKLGAVDSITIYAPAAADGSLGLQVSHDGATFLDFQSGGADVDLTLSKALTIQDICAEEARIFSTSAETSDREIHVQVNEGGAP